MAGDESLKPEQALGVTRRQFLGTAVASGAALLVGKSDVIFGADSTTASKMASNPTFALGGDLTVNRLGFGAMRITGEGIWGWPPDRQNALKVLRRAVDLGVNLIDTAADYQGSEAILELFEASLPAILAGEIPRHPQGDHGSFHRREELEPASKIQLDSRMAVRELLNLLRARTFAPHPGVRFRDGDEVYEVRISIDAVEQGQGR